MVLFNQSAISRARRLTGGTRMTTQLNVAYSKCSDRTLTVHLDAKANVSSSYSMMELLWKNWLYCSLSKQAKWRKQRMPFTCPVDLR